MTVFDHAPLLQFVPHGYCMRWDPGVIWLHVISDAFIVLAYASIPFLLLTILRKRKDLPFHWMIIAFSAFILACGATHLMSIVTVWQPLYRLEGIFKLCTAIASVVTAIGLYRLLPVILRIPSTVELQKAHAALAYSHSELVRRTAELAESHKALEQSNEAHLQSETEFRTLADSMPQIVWTARPDGFVDYFNERWYNFTGFDRQLFGDPSWMPLLHPDDVQRRRDAWYASVRSGLPFKEEYRFWDRASGTYRWHLGRAVPVKDALGNVIKWFGGCTDIDDYKRAETGILTLNSELESRVSHRTEELTRLNEELRRTHTWFQAILDSATEVSIMALDNRGVITFFNSGSERLLGYKAEELVGKCTPHKLYSKEERELRAQQLSEELGRQITEGEIFLAANQPRGSFVSESVYLHRDGTRIDVSLAVSPMIDANGERLGKLAIAVDMRPRKALEEQLKLNNARLQEQTQKAEDANHAKSDFISVISHELRTPMNSILGMADLLLESELNEVQRRYVGVFKRASASLLSLVNDILDVSKIESGRFELEQVEFDLRSVVETSMEIVRPKSLEQGIQLSCTIGKGTPTFVVGDPLRLQQILVNLLGNAIKFTEVGGVSLTVSVGSEPNRLQFEVTDSGIGIPADKLEAIFQDFTQADNSTTRRYGGTGLGLGICRRLVNLMGGTLQVHSVLGQGSTFYFNVLFAVPSQQQRQSSDFTADLAGRRVFIVDNNSTSRLIFAEMCGSWGMHTAECGNAEGVMPALVAAGANNRPYELVIIDRSISKSDGLELVSAIRNTYPRLPILVTTSDQMPGDQTRVLSFGGTEFAIKPLGRAELLRIVCRLLAKAGDSKTEATMKPAPPLADSPEKIIDILIADDSEDSRFLLQEYLKNGPYRVQFVENGKSALEAAKAGHFDLILMDMQMPVMDGLTAVKLIRQAEKSEGHRPVRILALTANARKEDEERSRSAGCDDHISKPIARNDLINKINKHAQEPASREGRSRVVTNIPPGLEEAAKRYIRSRKNDLPRLIDLFDAAEFDEIRRMAHDMKGTAGAYGFPDLGRLGMVLENSAIERNADQMSKELLELFHYVQEAESLVSSVP